MSRTFALLLVLALAAPACDIRPLTSADLYGVRDAASPDVHVKPDAGADTLPDAATDGDARPDAEAPPDATPAETGSDAPATACPQACASDQFCDELAGRCAPRTGVGMLSGIVVDTCTGASIDALVGIAGHRLCSFTGKGSYFFRDLPLGRLKLAAAKDGYDVYGATVDIVPGGVVHDIRMERTGGCATPLPAQVACACTAPTCQP